MVVLQDCPVIVEEGETGARVDVEVVGGSCVVEVVDDGGEQQSKHLKVRQPFLNKVEKS